MRKLDARVLRTSYESGICEEPLRSAHLNSVTALEASAHAAATPLMQQMPPVVHRAAA